jgi:hypothetical protein
MPFSINRFERISGPKTDPARVEKAAPNGRSIRGAGDLVAMVLQPGARLLDLMLGTALADCDDCKARRQAINKLLPFRRG